MAPALIAVSTGALVAVQSRGNGELSRHVGTGLFPAWLTMVSGAALIVLVVCLHAPSRKGMVLARSAVSDGALPRIALIGGTFGSMFLVTQSVTVPIIGVAVFSVGAVAGQTTGSLAVDRLGIGAAGRRAITWQRVVASILAVAAVAIGISDRLQSAPGAIVFAAFAFLAGVFIAPQQALNGRVAVSARSPFVAALVNFVGGAIAMTLVIGVALAIVGVTVHDPLGAPWWAYLGGVLGVTVIAGAAAVVPILGVLVFSLISVFGQLAGALMLDIVAPTPGTNVGWHLLAGLVLTFAAIVMAGYRRS